MAWLDDLVRNLTGVSGEGEIQPFYPVAEPQQQDTRGLQFTGTTGRSATNNNPLNLEYRPGSYQDKYGAELEPQPRGGSRPRFAKFPNMMAGYQAGLDQIRLDQDPRRGHTLASFVNKFAPPHENPTSDLVRQYAGSLGVSPDTPLSEIPPEKLIVPMLARESSTRIVGQSPREKEIFNALISKRAPAQKAFQPYEIAAAGNEIPGPPSTHTLPEYDPKGPDVSYLDALIKGTPAAPPVMKAAPPGGFPLAETMPPQSYEPAEFATQAQVAAVDEPATMIAISAKKRFPFMPLEKAVRRYQVINGEVSYLGNDGKIHKETGEGFSEMVKSILAKMVGRAPEAIGGTLGLISPIPGGAEIGVGIGGTGRRLMNQLIYGEKPNYLTGAAGDILGAALSRIPAAGANIALQRLGGGGQIGRMVARDQGVFNPAEVQRLVDLGNQYGVRLTVPEVTNSPTLQAVWGNLAQNPRWPNANQKIAEFIRQTRNPEVASAIQRELETISPANVAPVQAGEMGQRVSQDILSRLRSYRSTTAEPFYQTAWERKVPVDISPVHQDIDNMLSTLAPNGVVAKRLNTIKNVLSEPVEITNPAGQTIKTTRPLSDLQQLHNARRDLSTMQNQWQGEGGVDPESMAAITALKAKLTGLMAEASPEYAAAQAKFTELSKPIDKFKYGATYQWQDTKADTLMMKLTKVGGDNLEDVPNIVFKYKPDAIAKARQWFVSNGYEDQWNTIVRAHLEQRLGQVADTVATREGNLGYAFKRKAFGNQADVDKLRSALDSKQFQSFKGLMDLMDQTTKIIYTNSQTAMQQGATQAIENLGGGVVARALTNIPITPQQWGQVLIRLRSPGNAAKLADALTDPANTGRIQSLRLLPNNAKKAVKVASFLTTVLGEEELQNQFESSGTVPQY